MHANPLLVSLTPTGLLYLRVSVSGLLVTNNSPFMPNNKPKRSKHETIPTYPCLQRGNSDLYYFGIHQ